MPTQDPSTNNTPAQVGGRARATGIGRRTTASQAATPSCPAHGTPIALDVCTRIATCYACHQVEAPFIIRTSISTYLPPAFAFYVPGSPHVILTELKLAMFSYQDYHMFICRSRSQVRGRRAGGVGRGGVRLVPLGTLLCG